ncbi:MAG TPA: threonine/serine exporter family protein, partial [Thermoanaerobaculia bacterium]|nr:threonine/serine exporter family protein [Thermoanaerobaculia bacterium]
MSSSSSAASPSSFDSSSGVAFALALGRALQTYGTPAHRLEEAMHEVVRLIGVEAHFFSTPTAIFASLGSGEQKRTELLRIEPGEVDLGKLEELNELANQVVQKRLTPGDAMPRIERIVAAPPRYGWTLTLLSFALTSAAASRFFGAGWNEITLALAIGLVVGLLAWTASRVQSIARMF